MSSCRVVLQSVLLPDDEVFDDARVLFYRAGLSQERHRDRVMPEHSLWDFKMVDGEKIHVPSNFELYENDCVEYPELKYDRALDRVIVPPDSIGDFSCYLNMCSAAKWFDLTYACDLTLDVDVSGSGTVRVFAYHVADFRDSEDIDDYFRNRDGKAWKVPGFKLPLETAEIARVPFASGDECMRVSVDLSHPDATLIGFAIEAGADGAAVYGGEWSCSVDSGHMRDIQLCIATTTFNNERYILRNVDEMKRMVAEDADLAGHFQMIVVDNGRTLTPSEIEDEHVKVFPNINAGGAGGFARGMIESLKLAKRPTHLLIMDDDVLILPESIKRTITLLSILRPAHWDDYISGAMLRMEDKSVQHEDIGYVHECGWFAPRKPAHTLDTIYDCAVNEVFWYDAKHEYAAWWYCCIPMKFVTEETLPVPVFIRGDDVEFSLRNQAKITSMNGICVWHVGFGGKFSAQMEYYQVIRNSFILQAFHQNASDIDFVDRVDVLFTELTSSFAYDYADLLLDAFEDYMNGPSILEKPNGIDIIKEKGKKNEKLVPYSEVSDEDINFKEMFYALKHSPINVARRKFSTFTRNEQQFVRTKGRGTGIVPYDWDYVFEFVLGRAQLLSINPRTGMACMRFKDLDRFDEVKRRYIGLTVRYIHEHEQIRQEWENAYSRFTSIGFWNEYLGLE